MSKLQFSLLALFILPTIGMAQANTIPCLDQVNKILVGLNEPKLNESQKYVFINYSGNVLTYPELLEGLSPAEISKRSQSEEQWANASKACRQGQQDLGRQEREASSAFYQNHHDFQDLQYHAEKERMIGAETALKSCNTDCDESLLAELKQIAFESKQKVAEMQPKYDELSRAHDALDADYENKQNDWIKSETCTLAGQNPGRSHVFGVCLAQDNDCIEGQKRSQVAKSIDHLVAGENTLRGLEAALPADHPKLKAFKENLAKERKLFEQHRDAHVVARFDHFPFGIQIPTAAGDLELVTETCEIESLPKYGCERFAKQSVPTFGACGKTASFHEQVSSRIDRLMKRLSDAINSK